MPEAAEGQIQVRPGRCAIHPDSAKVGDCQVCGRPLCLACAIPVRGRLIGPECVASVVTDAPPLEAPAIPVTPRGDRLALVGFSLAVLVSAFPWSRFGDSSRFFGAWTPHWSMVAALAAVAGLLFTLVARVRTFDPRLKAAAYGGLGLVVSVASFIQHRHPPLLTEATSWPWLAVLGGALALLGAFRKVAARAGPRRRR